VKKDSLAKIAKRFGYVEKELAGRPFITGDNSRSPTPISS